MRKVGQVSVRSPECRRSGRERSDDVVGHLGGGWSVAVRVWRPFCCGSSLSNLEIQLRPLVHHVGDEEEWDQEQSSHANIHLDTLLATDTGEGVREVESLGP